MVTAQIGHESMTAIKRKWDSKYWQHQSTTAAAAVLTENSFLLPEQGTALDLACGLGGNALFLAECGLQVQAWDISSVALEVLLQNAARKSLDIAIKQCKIDALAIPANTFDVIVVSRFLDRMLCNAIMAALRKHGLLFYQTFTQDKLNDEGPRNPNFLLRQNELLRLFEPLTTVFYKENSQIGDLLRGERNEALFIGQKLT